MRGIYLLTLTALALASWLASASFVEGGPVGVSLGVRIGGPAYYPRPYYARPIYAAPYYAPYYRPAVVVASPIVVEPSPVYVQPAPIVVQPRTITSASASAPVIQEDEVMRQWQLLSHADERVRGEAAMALGRMRADRAIDALAAVLARDASPHVRESAARALGLIGTQRVLPALNNAALSDGDRDVRRSAQFSIEVIHGQLRGN